MDKSVEARDPHAVPFPQGRLWDRLGFELVCGEDPERVAREYGEPVETVREINDLFWDGYSRYRWLEEAEEYGLLEEALALPNEELYARLLIERERPDRHSA
jgi:hypothetical protein